MVSLAALGAQFVGQFREQTLEGVELLYVGTDAARFRELVVSRRPRVVLVDLSEGTLDDAGLKALFSGWRPDLCLLTYDFARRKFVRELQASTQARVLQSPVTLDTLRAHLAPILVRDHLLGSTREPTPMNDTPRFTREQLGRLMELTSTIQCECPNHVAQLVEKLQAFEAYSRDCESRDEADRAVHAALAGITQQARKEMERALVLLVEHEKIDLSR